MLRIAHWERKVGGCGGQLDTLKSLWPPLRPKAEFMIASWRPKPSPLQCCPTSLLCWNPVFLQKKHRWLCRAVYNMGSLWWFLRLEKLFVITFRVLKLLGELPLVADILCSVVLTQYCIPILLYFQACWEERWLWMATCNLWSLNGFLKWLIELLWGLYKIKYCHLCWSLACGVGYLCVWVICLFKVQVILKNIQFFKNRRLNL